MERLDEELSFKQNRSRKYYVLIGLVALAAGFIIGILIGVYGVDRDGDAGNVSDNGQSCTTASPRNGTFLPGVPEKIIQDGPADITDKLIENMKAENIKEYLRNLTSHPHLAGTPADYRLAHQLEEFWKDVGLDEVRLSPYDILLSYPNDSDPNLVMFRDKSGNITYTSKIAEAILTDNSSDIVLPFNAYSPKADVEADIVYVNYARVEDFNWLVKNGSVNVTGKLVLARYGKIFRGDKVNIAHRFGAIGVILYSDPKDYAWGDDPQVYPDDWWLPGSGVQRGTILLVNGDPMTPGYPSIDSAYRYDVEGENGSLPKIPCHAIGYDDARFFLGELDGPEAPPDWRGNLNVTYHLGGLREGGSRVKLHVSTYTDMRRTYNTIGIIRGEIEPDRYVIIGNHRDAWVFGAIDPSSGTATMMEISRVIGKLVKDGWRPRRSIMFCSWGAEEYGLHGSTEWVEHYIKSLGERVVAYLNVDIAVQGNYSLRANASPLLYSTVYEATKKVPNPNDAEVAAGRKTVYDTFLNSFEWTINGESQGKPIVGNLGSGSDYAPFLQRIGIPCLDTSYTYDSNTMKLGSYPLYHSAYETFYAVDELIDRGFKYHTAVANVNAEAARMLADALILPFNVSDYAFALLNFKNILYEEYGTLMSERGGINLDQLSLAIDNFTESARDFHERLSKIDRNNPMLTRMVNDQMIQVERAFTDPAGLPGRPLYRHIVFAPSSVNTYAGASYPGIADALFEIETAPNQAERWEKVKQHYSVVVFTIQSAASTLQDVTHFMDQSMS